MADEKLDLAGLQKAGITEFTDELDLEPLLKEKISTMRKLRSVVGYYSKPHELKAALGVTICQAADLLNKLKKIEPG